MPRSSSSKRWLKEHFADYYVKRAQQLGYRSRAAFKLLEIQDKDKLLSPAMVVVDLGAAPGGWSQIAAGLVGPKGKIFALDILPMDPLPGVEFIQGDFSTEEVLNQLLSALHDQSIDLVMSDMSPNITGIKTVDQPRAMFLTELALDFAKKALKLKGAFVAKVFQGEGFDSLLQEARSSFKTVKIRKPEASRARSQEVYLVAKGLKVNH